MPKNECKQHLHNIKHKCCDQDICVGVIVTSKNPTNQYHSIACYKHILHIHSHNPEVKLVDIFQLCIKLTQVQTRLYRGQGLGFRFRLRVQGLVQFKAYCLSFRVQGLVWFRIQDLGSGLVQSVSHAHLILHELKENGDFIRITCIHPTCSLVRACDCDIAEHS